VDWVWDWDWDGLDLCAGLFYEHCFAMLIIITTNPVPDSWRKSIKSQWLVYDDVKYW